jgi:hypothetical protein
MTMSSVRHARSIVARRPEDDALDDATDDLDDGDRDLLHASLERAAEQFRAGEGIPARDALALLGKPSAR